MLQTVCMYSVCKVPTSIEVNKAECELLSLGLVLMFFLSFHSVSPTRDRGTSIDGAGRSGRIAL